MVVPLFGDNAERDARREAGLAAGAGIAARRGSRLLLVSVVAMPGVAGVDQVVGSGAAGQGGEMARERRRHLEQARQWCHDTVDDRLSVDVLLRYGDPAAAILDVVAALDEPTLVLCGALGDDTTRAIRDGARCPVLLVSPHERHIPVQPPDTLANAAEPR